MDDARCSAAPDNAATQPSAPAGGPGPVMIVEDDPGISSVLRNALEDEGYLVEAASNGCAALCRLAGGGYSAVVLDWNLPCFSGGQVAEELQEWPGSIPIILMSADPEWKLQRRAEWIG